MENKNQYKAQLHSLEMYFSFQSDVGSYRKVNIDDLYNNLELVYKHQIKVSKIHHRYLREIDVVERAIDKAKSYLEVVKGKHDYFERILKEWLPFLENKKQNLVNPLPKKEIVTKGIGTTIGSLDNEIKSEESEENDIVKSTIEDYLEPIKDCFQNKVDYDKTINHLIDYLQGKDIEISKPYIIKQGYKYKLANALCGIYETLVCKPLVSGKDYLLLAIKMFSIYESETIDKENLVQSRLYKYFTAKEKKPSKTL